MHDGSLVYIYIYTRDLPSISIDGDRLAASTFSCICRSFVLFVSHRRSVTFAEVLACLCYKRRQGGVGFDRFGHIQRKGSLAFGGIVCAFGGRAGLDSAVRSAFGGRAASDSTALGAFAAGAKIHPKSVSG